MTSQHASFITQTLYLAANGRTLCLLEVAVVGERERVTRHVRVNERIVIRNAEALREVLCEQPFSCIEREVPRGRGLAAQPRGAATPNRRLTGPVRTMPLPVLHVPTPSQPAWAATKRPRFVLVVRESVSSRRATSVVASKPRKVVMTAISSF